MRHLANANETELCLDLLLKVHYEDGLKHVFCSFCPRIQLLHFAQIIICFAYALTTTVTANANAKRG